MEVLFYILLFMSIWHFFYERVVANSLRHGLRYKFFKLRDELRTIKIDGLSKKDEFIYESLDNSICHLIRSMSFISLGNYYRLKNEFDKKESDSIIRKSKDLIEQAENEKLKIIDEELTELGATALVINNGALLIYLAVPIILFALILKITVQFDKLNKGIRRISKNLIYSSENFEENNISMA
jgi:uncharacterized membrane protein